MGMRYRFWLIAVLCWGLIPSVVSAKVVPSALKPFKVSVHTSNIRCLSCHGEKGFSVPQGEGSHGERTSLYVDRVPLNASVHGERRCIECHTTIQYIPHRQDQSHKVDCIQCHSGLEEGYLAKKRGWDRQAVSKIVQNIAFHMESVHGQPSKNDPAKPNTYCSDCHQGHAVFPDGSLEHRQFLLESPRICGRCHQAQLAEYEESVHGVAALRFGQEAPAVCVDCHTAHKISKVHEDPAKLVITKSCGSCHLDAYESYTGTYHGQVNVLGFTYTAKCFDCHSAHSNRRVDDTRSRVVGKNREKTCLRCHEGVSPGFLTFLPHGNTHDFERYPEMWLASKFMILLLIGVFLFFWSHSLMWFYRERKERKALMAAGMGHEISDMMEKSGQSGQSGKSEESEESDASEERRSYVWRFALGWRAVHLSFALSIMLLAFTGMTVMYADSFWASWVSDLFGSAETMARLHRFGAILFAGVFLIHLAVVLHKLLWRERETFRWFGPHSLLPRWQDLWDFIAMMRWFFGKGPRPVFDHWSYWEKFDYWAPFWGMFIIGSSGLVLWFPKLAGEYFPGWIFNVATIIHGEEAFLAIVFIFSVHFFNCHFRPSKFPLDIMMFVGRMPLEEFKEERSVEYQRLEASGELNKLLTAPPVPTVKLLSKILGFILVSIGLTLLTMALTGFVHHMFK